MKNKRMIRVETEVLLDCASSLAQREGVGEWGFAQEFYEYRSVGFSKWILSFVLRPRRTSSG